MSLAEDIQAELNRGYARIRPLDSDGRRFWLKRRERLGLRMRLQKGSAARAFDAERQAFETLSDAGVPVASLAASGDDWMVLEDGGSALRDILRSDGMDAVENLPIYAAAGRALAKWHKAGFAHGRPSIKDILWDGTRITFIDLERFSRSQGTQTGQPRDLIIFAHSFFSETQGDSRELTTAINAYRDAIGMDNWHKAQKICRRMRWIRPALSLVKYRKPGRGKDIRAALLTLDFFTD